MAKQMSVRQMLENAGVHFDSFGKNKAGNYVIRREFFYTHGYTSDQYAAALKEKLPQANVIDHGEIWKAFSGGASVGKQSHWFVEFTV